MAWSDIAIWGGFLLITAYAMGTLYERKEQSMAELRARLYSRCSWCAELIHRQQAKQPLRPGELEDLLVHVPEHHGLWLEMLRIMDEL